MKPVKCLIVDDEELARTLLENYISRLPYLSVVAKCKSPVEAIQVMQTEEIDLLFLDIQMPELTGVEFLKTMYEKPLVIFTTAYPDYALEGYELDIIDYLLKPFSFTRFVQAVTKAVELLKLKNLANQQGHQSIVTPKVTEEKDYILVKSEHKVYRIKFADILYIQSMREYVAFYTAEGRILSLKSLKKLETELPGHLFMRIHKSYIIAINKVSTLEGNMVHVGSEKLPIGSNYREEVMKRVF